MTSRTSIAKRPKPADVAAAGTPLSQEERERREEAFLAGAPDVAAKAQAPSAPSRKRMQPVHLRFEPDLLQRIDAAVEDSDFEDRASWIRYVVRQALKQSKTTK